MVTVHGESGSLCSRTMDELQEIKVEASCGAYGFGSDKQNARSNGRNQTRSSTSVAIEAS